MQTFNTKKVSQLFGQFLLSTTEHSALKNAQMTKNYNDLFDVKEICRVFYILERTSLLKTGNSVFDATLWVFNNHPYLSEVNVLFKTSIQPSFEDGELSDYEIETLNSIIENDETRLEDLPEANAGDGHLGIKRFLTLNGVSEKEAEEITQEHEYYNAIENCLRQRSISF